MAPHLWVLCCLKLLVLKHALFRGKRMLSGGQWAGRCRATETTDVWEIDGWRHGWIAWFSLMFQQLQSVPLWVSIWSYLPSWNSSSRGQGECRETAHCSTLSFPWAVRMPPKMRHSLVNHACFCFSTTLVMGWIEWIFLSIQIFVQFSRFKYVSLLHLDYLHYLVLTSDFP